MLILVNSSTENLWATKAIQMDFELASGLGVNFHKSSLIAINCDLPFLELSEYFLNCKIEFLSFRYLRFPVGANNKLASIWQPLINLISKRLHS